MIRFSSTRSILTRLEHLYSNYSGNDSNIPVAYCKLATLEVCGWLEEAFDETALNCVRSRLKTKDERKHLIWKIAVTHGFDYNNQARPLICHAIGIVRLLEVEKKLEKDGSLSRLKSEIGALNVLRRDAAHTSIAGAAQVYPAPSRALRTFETCLPILQRYWTLVRN